MALRARLSAPRAEQNAWPWHHAKWTALSASLLFGGDRRMEAENYLASGYGIRLAMEARKHGRTEINNVANVWQPSRLKGILVSPEFGTPFLAATQVFDQRPVPRKFLSLDRTDSATERFVTPGMILVTCSGSVGRATLAHKPHEKILISHDLLRVEPKQPEWWGWLYAYLRAPQTRAMMSAAQYGHIIKHLEVDHLDALPIPRLRDELRAEFNERVEEILTLRSKAHERVVEAHALYASAFPSFQPSTTAETGFTVPSHEIFGRRRRLEANCFNPTANNIMAAFKAHAHDVEPLSKLVQRVFVPGRFKHVYGEGGAPYLDSADILEVCPDVGKHVLSLSAEKQKEYQVKPHWLLMPCSGQVYGNIGHVVMATDWHTGKVLSNHILRIAPKDKGVQPGYLQCALGHPTLGRPLVIRFAFGSSVPELAPEDIATIPVPRLSRELEKKIAVLMENAAEFRMKADETEEAVAADAESLIDLFLAGDSENFVAGLSVADQ
jgi:hypothetical protein